MNAPDLLDAMHIAWVSLLKQELISASNIEHAPLQVGCGRVTSGTERQQ